jgi:hypothetical protein
MNIPLGPFISLGKTGYNLFSYFFKGPKIDGALKFLDGGQTFFGPSPKNPTDSAVFYGEAINVYDFYSRFQLTLKNTSKYSAYNIRLINGREIFSQYENLEQLTSLDPGESITITCRFLTISVHCKGNETNLYHGIPESKKNKYLTIAYENEARTTFYTQFKIDENEAHNNYLLKAPKK